MLRVAVFLFLLQGYNCYLVLLTNVSREVNVSDIVPRNSGAPPEAFDWRDRKMVSPIKNQLNCGACWAFSIVAGIESHLKIYLGQEMILSEQFLIDCEDASKGCGPAGLLTVFADIITKFNGVLQEQDYYPYADGRMECRWKPRPGRGKNYGEVLSLSARDQSRPVPVPVPVIGFRRVAADEDIMAEYVYQYGPLSAGINSASMDKYNGGIDEPTDENCDPDALNHAVLIVGYNVYECKKTGKKVPYWIIKNSWGPVWGDNGFYYLVRGRNACGITKDVSFPFVN